MPDEGRLRVGFCVTEEDVFQFYIYHVLHEPSIRAALVLGSLFLFGFATYLFAKQGIPFAPIFGLLAGIAFALVYRWLLRRKAHQANRLLIGALGEHNVEISSEGLFASSPGAEGLRRWEAIERVVGMPSCLCFYLGKGFGAIIPRQ